MSISRTVSLSAALVLAMSAAAAPHAVATEGQQTDINRVICVVSGPPVPTICVPKPV